MAARVKGILTATAGLYVGGMTSPASGPFLMVPSAPDVVAATDWWPATDWLVCDSGTTDTVLALLVLLLGDVSGGVVGGVGAVLVPGVGFCLTIAGGAAGVVGGGGVGAVLVPGVGSGLTDAAGAAGGGACTLCLGCHCLGTAAAGDTGVALLVGSCGGLTDLERGVGTAGGTLAGGGVGFLEEVRSTTSCRGWNVMAWNGHESQV